MSRSALPLAALAAAILFMVAFATTLVPWLTRERSIVSSTPTNLPLSAIAEVRLRHGARVCVSGFGLDATAEGLQLIVNNPAESATTPPLHVDVRASGYRSSARLAGGYPSHSPVVIPLTPPPGDVDAARVCVRNLGRASALVGTATPRELANVRVRLDGRTIVTQPSLTFVQRRSASVVERLPEIFERVSAFRPFPAAPLLLYPLALLVLIGVPLAIVVALALAQRGDEDRA